MDHHLLAWILLWIFLGTGALGLAAMIASFVYFDRLLRIQFSQHHEEWVRMGCPIGFYWVPSGARTAAGGMARTTLRAEWLARAPEWISQNEQALRCHQNFLRRSRTSKILTTLFFLSCAVNAVFLYVRTLMVSG